MLRSGGAKPNVCGGAPAKLSAAPASAAPPPRRASRERQAVREGGRARQPVGDKRGDAVRRQQPQVREQRADSTMNRCGKGSERQR